MENTAKTGTEMKNHPQLRITERRIDLHANELPMTSRICFMLTKQGNTSEYMVIDHGQPGFQDVLNQGMMAAKLIETIRREKKEEDERESRYRHYLVLKEEFDDGN